jgi:hypothetical protein
VCDVVVDVSGDGLQRGSEFGWRLGLVGGGERDASMVTEVLAASPARTTR